MRKGVEDVLPLCKGGVKMNRKNEVRAKRLFVELLILVLASWRGST